MGSVDDGATPAGGADTLPTVDRTDRPERAHPASLDATLLAGPERPVALADTRASAPGGPAGAHDAEVPEVSRGATIGRYVVLERIGSGTMGLVVAAYDPTLDRKVAIKLVRPDHTGSTIGRQRLIREAQAMARLSHPNVVTVFEVGTVGDHVFLAMEYVAGTTLGEWLARPGRTRREIVEAFVAAGRGLAAAHKAGIVHRDFKPANVLVAADDHVRVADFGLATAADTESLEGSGEARTLGDSLSMTATGSLLGTPAYMAPEQHQGRPADARADQFAFCVALYEALYRELPYDGGEYPVYAAHVLAGEVRDPPRGNDVPAALRRVVLRGLAIAPAKRYAGMTELIAELRRDPTIVRRRLAIGGAIAVGAVALAIVASRTTDEDPCGAAVPSLTGVWDGAIRDRISEAFAATRRPSAAAAAARVTSELDARAAAIGVMRRDACVATHVRHDQSPDLLDRRVQCLDARTAQLGALAAVLAAGADPEIVDNAVTAAMSLPRIEACADRAALLAAVPPPDDPAVRAEVDALQAELARAEALLAAGKYADALAAVTPVTTGADRIDYAPLAASAHFTRASIHGMLEQSAEAASEARLGGERAAAAHDDLALARSWLQLYGIIGYDQARPGDVVAMDPLIHGAVVRAGNDPELLAQLANIRGAIALGRGDYPVSAEQFLSAERQFAALLGPKHPRVAYVLTNAGTALHSAGRYDDARAALERALAMRIETLGDQHPAVGQSLYALGGLIDDMGRHAEALEFLQRALAINEAMLPANHPRLATTYASVAVVLDSLERSAEALPLHEKGLAILEQHPADNQIRIASALSNLAVCHQRLGHPVVAIKTYERALAIREATVGPDHPDVATVLNSLAYSLYQTGDKSRANALWKRVLEIRRAKLGDDHPETLMSFGLLGQVAYEAGSYKEALRLLDLAIGTPTAAGGTEGRALPEMIHLRANVYTELGQHAEAARDLARARDMYVDDDRLADAADAGGALAEALWRRGPAHRAQARAEATLAIERHTVAGKKPEAQALRAWLAAHGGAR